MFRRKSVIFQDQCRSSEVRMKLSYKIFGAFLVTSLAIAGLTIGTLHFLGRRIFVNYVKKIQIEKLSDLTDMLVSEYEMSGGWDQLAANPRRWYRMVRSAGRRNTELERLPPDHSHDLEREHQSKTTEGSPMPSPPFDSRSHIFLLDANKHLVAGRAKDYDDSSLREIELNGKTIGWLGFSKREPRLTPLEAAFLREQNKLFYLIGGGIFLLTAAASFFLSRHLLSPIRKLTEGTQALASREFDTRITVRSGDELGQLASDFNAMAQTLEEYEEMRKQWISDISHELRTPLSILRGEIEAMQDGLRDVNQQALDSLYSEVLHLSKIVGDLHELSMADAGALRLDLKPLDPIQVLKETVKLYRNRFEAAGMIIQTELETDSKLAMLGDAGRLGQLYGNILENALRYADAPGSLKIWQNTSSGREISLCFEDSGPGVPEPSVGRLFDRLYRVDSSRTRNKGGSGLGLAICKAIVESHGGTISAANGSLGGLKLQIRLPLA